MAHTVHVDRMLRNMTAKQFLEWEAYANLEPFGEMRADWRIASVREMIHNIQVDKKHRKPVKDFLLQFGEPIKRKQTWQEQLAVAKLIAAIYSNSSAESK